MSRSISELQLALAVNYYPDFRGDVDWKAYAERLDKAGFGDRKPLLDALHWILLTSCSEEVKRRVEQIIKENE